MAAPPFKLLVIDDHPVVLYGLRLLFQAHARFAICGEAQTAAEACALAEALTPDFVIADLVLGGRDGLSLIEDLAATCPAARILVYSSQDELIHARHTLRAGARGYVSKAEGLESVERALEVIAGGDIRVSPGVQALLVREYAGEHAPRSGLATLSTRELQVLQLIGRRLDLQEVARRLALSVKTIGTYRERLKIKLGLETVRELERVAEAYIEDAREPEV
jgi:DNA-binding NarL/FixJ family response regulator